MAPEQIAVFIGMTLWIGSIVYKIVKAKRAQREQKQLVAQELDGRDANAVIKASPFSYAHWQGEDGYRIIDERKDPPYIGFAGTVEQAESQILLLIAAESSRK